MYDHRQIMRTAWHNRRRFGWDMKTSLRRAWYEARQAAPIWKVVGISLYNGSKTVIASCVTVDRAGELQWFNQYRFDRVDIVAA